MMAGRYHSRNWPSRPANDTTHWALRCLSSRRLLLMITAITGMITLYILIPRQFCSLLFPPPNPTSRCQTLEFALSDEQHNDTDPSQYHAFPPVPVNDTSLLSRYRRADTIDTFANYSYRNHPKCSISSLSLHNPFFPLCPDRRSFLKAFTGGGRIGFDAPFMPRDCDMRWYTTDEVCEILARFEKVIIVGDSMMRHIIGAMNVILRKDLGYGAVTGWNFGEEESEKCFCTHQMDVKACSVQGIFRTSDVLKHDPDSFACPHTLTKTSSSSDGSDVYEYTSPVNLIIELMLKYPLDPTELERLQSLLPRERPQRPIAFVLGHGLWNDLDLQATVNWLDGTLEAIYTAAPYLHPKEIPYVTSTEKSMENEISRRKTDGEVDKEKNRSRPMAYILMVTPSAAGIRKPDAWIVSQGDKALQIFEHSVRDEIYESDGRFVDRGIEHIGTWNMSVQMDKWDGVHLNLRGNLIKAMGVVNWLAGVEVEKW